MRVELITFESVSERRFWVQHQQVLAMVLRHSSIEQGSQRSKMKGVDYEESEL